MSDHDSWAPGILADHQIKHLATEHGMIDPFVAKPIRHSSERADGTSTRSLRRVVSYGLGHYGYDMRVADEFQVFSNLHTTIVDPKRMDASGFHKWFQFRH